MKSGVPESPRMVKKLVACGGERARLGALDEDIKAGLWAELTGYWMSRSVNNTGINDIYYVRNGSLW